MQIKMTLNAKIWRLYALCKMWFIAHLWFFNFTGITGICSPDVSDRIIISCVCVTLLLMGVSVLLLYKLGYIKTRGDDRKHTHDLTVYWPCVTCFCFYFLPIILNSNNMSSLSSPHLIS